MLSGALDLSQINTCLSMVREDAKLVTHVFFLQGDIPSPSYASTQCVILRTKTFRLLSMLHARIAGSGEDKP